MEEMMYFLHTVVSVFITVLILRGNGSAAYSSGSKEQYLRHNLDFDPTNRPVKQRDSISVEVGINPIIITDYSFSEQYLKMNISLVTIWKDETLIWDPERFDNLEYLTIPLDKIWSPDLSIYTATSSAEHFPKPGTDAIVRYDGQVFWVSNPLPIYSIQNSCPEFNRAQDKEVLHCSISVISWKYHSSQLDLQVYRKTNESQVVENDIFVHYMAGYRTTLKITSVETYNEIKDFTCCPYPYPVVHFKLIFEKQKE